MTTADVPDFAAHVREMMLEALHEMSPSGKTSKPIGQVVSEKVSTDKVSKQEEEPPSTPLEYIGSVVSPSIGVIPSSVEGALSSVGSTSSLASSSVSVGQRSGREDGTETEEDDEMVLVGRPKK
jgi:lysophosphatidate acyltransferase